MAKLVTSKNKKLVSLFVASMLLVPSAGCTSKKAKDEEDEDGRSSGYRGGSYVGNNSSSPDKDPGYKKGVGLKSGGSAG